MNWIWASFCDPDLPEGSQFLGVVIAPGTDMRAFTNALSLLGLDPGGDMVAIHIPPEHLPPEEYRMRLLNREEAEFAALY